MALVELRPTRTPRTAPPASKPTDKIEVGAVVIEQRASGDLLIYTCAERPITRRVSECDVTIRSKVASEIKLLISNAHVQDLIVALDAVLGNRKPG